MTDRSSPDPQHGITHVDALAAGTRLGEFEVLALLGVGGFGMVYKAFDHSLHRAVAIKEYMPSALAGRAQGQSLWVRSSTDQATYQAGLASFVGEARLLAQFDHPSLVKVFRFWEANNTAYMVMPLYSGMTFKQARAQMRTPPPEAWLRKVLWSVLSALRVLHSSNTLHRDISPDNIFLQDNGPPVLLDLGAARHAINDQDRKHTAVLKVNYAPIEQYAEGDEELRQGPWSDLYSLAAVVHGCLCNDTPLPSTLRAIRDRMVSFSRVARTVKKQFGIEYSAPFVAAIAQSLALRPQDRPQSIDSFLRTMDMLSPPDGIQDFDFRAELGDIWVEPADQPGPGLVTPTVDVTSGPRIPANAAPAPQGAEAESGVTVDTTAHRAPEGEGDGVADSVMPEDVQDTLVLHDITRPDVGLPPSLAAGKRAGTRRVRAEGDDRRRDAGSAPRASGHGRRWVAAGAVVSVVVLAGLGIRGLSDQRGAPRGDDIITEMADPRTPAASAASAPLAAASATAGAPALAASDLAVAPTPSAPASEPPAAPSAFVVAPAPKPVVPKPATRRPVVEPPPAPVAAPAPPEPAPAPPPVVVASRPRPSPPPRPPGPVEVCADANFLARPLCIHQECQKPAQAGHPVCVENRRRFEAEELRRRQTPN